MSNEFLVGLLIGGPILFFSLLFLVIHSATGSGKKKFHDEIKIKLLVKIAEKQGVTQDEINRILKP